ncbi:ribonuclease HII [Syntrophotalea carbinolica DSM 2380]|uniref:Ribonuclease HII n=1 Tax=Syntrophotalea carbinolica (strain DSM 2380 / NBRC 103641 / GraBd1) TaxID=338963 RepID=RNH2_SYNC1|nr:ribonuclease HII [Syntrophotalea carbinolica]Q3A2F0.1 RecName: Full=Ribonuclease HII; Short=RNase HII [Syntrophotalea carbinolica DSM 2380]ABA89457.1 ribonuclease HII [Syntrophotalea carbinolica DSM 2380]
MLELFPSEDVSPLYFEQRLSRQGYRRIAGIDEAGRGPLAGPVVAAAVVLPPVFDLPGLNDSKKISAKLREKLFPQIRRQALDYGIGLASAQEVDGLNVLQATLLAMRRALDRLAQPADYLLVDGITPVPLPLPQKTLKQGDSRSLSIAAASVLAKVVRDRLMTTYDARFPEYGFAGHKGYGSAAHRAAIARLGPCPLHRATFRGVREYL